MWIIHYLIFPILYLLLVMLLMVYWSKPKTLLKFIHKLTPKKVQVFIRKVERLLLKNPANVYNVYGFAALAIFVIILVIVYLGASVGLGLIEYSIEARESIVIAGFSIVYIIVFFKEYLNKIIWQLSKTNKDLLPFAIRWLVDGGSKMIYASMFFYMPFIIVLLFINTPTFLLLREVYAYPMIIIVGTISFLGFSLMLVGSMLWLKVSDIEMLIQILDYLKNLEKDTRKTKFAHRLVLSKAVDYSQRIVAEDLYLVKDVDVSDYFETLYMAKIWGDNIEKQVTSTKIDDLITTLDDGDHRKFLEILSSLDSNSKLSNLRKLRDSTKITTFTRKKKPRRLLGYIPKVILATSAILTIINVIKGLIEAIY